MKKFLLFLLGLIVLMVIAITIFLLTFDLNSYREYITGKMSEVLGRPVTIGHMEMKISMIPTIKINDIRVSNPEQFAGQDPLLAINSAEATMAIAPLFSKRIEIQNVKANTIQVNLIKKGSRDNWTIESKTAPQKKGEVSGVKSDWQTRVDSISAQSIQVAFYQEDKKYQIDLSDFSLKQLKVLSLTANWNEQAFQVTATVDDLLKLMRKEPDYLFNIEVLGAGTTVKLAGSIGDTVAFKKLLFNVDIEGASLKQTLENFDIKNRAIPAQSFALSAVLQGDLSKFQLTKLDTSMGGNKFKASFTGVLESLSRQPMIELAGKMNLSDWTLGQVWGIQPFDADLEMVLSQNVINVKKFLYQAGRSDLQLSGQFMMNKKRPEMKLNIMSEYLNLQDILQTDETKYRAESKQVPQKKFGIPDLPVPLKFLQSFDGVITIVMPHWQVTDEIVGYLGKTGAITVKNGVLTTNGFRLDVLGGHIIADVVADSNGDQKFALKMTGNNLNLNGVKMLNDVIQNATMDFAIDVTAVGDTTRKIIASSNGNLEIEIPQGMIIDQFFNNDIVEVLGGRKKRTVDFSTADQVNELLCGVVKVRLENGEIKAQNNIALETPHVGFLVGGSIRLTDMWVNLSVRPIVYQAQKTAVGQVLNAATRSIRVIGTIPQVKWEPDTVAVVKGLLEQQSFKPYQTCAIVLGHKSQGELRAESKKMQMLPEPTVAKETTPKPQTPQEQFRQQFLETLSQALQ
ncbi:MAG: AsmA family protein [Pseudomonadota bacterium]|nr:AsmA family protein [Pseudomonadota bacterium]